MQKLQIYTKSWCHYCVAAKRLLGSRGISFIEYDVERNPDLELEMRARSNRSSVPQVFVGDHHVGGFDDLAGANQTGVLDELLAREAQIVS